MSLKNYEIGKIDPSLKGEAYLKKVNEVLSPESLANCNPEEETETVDMEKREHEIGGEVAGK